MTAWKVGNKSKVVYKYHCSPNIGLLGEHEDKYIPIVLLMRDLLSSILFQQANNLKNIGIPSKAVGLHVSVDPYGLNKSVCF